MPFQNAGELRIFNFELLKDHSIQHGVFTRHGGVSSGSLLSLNVGNTVGDRPERVAENRRRSFEGLDRDPNRAYEVWQIHSATVLVADAPLRSEDPYQPGDAIITSRPGIALFMRFADCVPILLSDPVAGVVGLVHAGWMGTVRGTASAAVKLMSREFGCEPKNIVAGIGPSIGPDHYEVGPDVVLKIENAFRADANGLIRNVDGKTYLDLWKANQRHLENAGVGQIELAGICTGCHLEDWYSHRVENGHTGRFGALISLT